MAERIYIEGDNARITAGEGLLVNVEMFDGRKFENLEPRRLFPVTGLTKYITLLDTDDVEQAVIRDVSNLMDDSRAVILHSLGEYYLIPKITRINKGVQEHHLFKMDVETDHGRFKFEVKNHYHDIDILYDGRILIRDSSDNRYEIPDFEKLDKKSIRQLNYDL